MRIVAVVMGMLVATTLAAQPVVMGSAAAREFVYRGKPIHPFCLDFPREASSRPRPLLLSKCSDTTVMPKSHPDGKLEAEYPREARELFGSASPFISYRVLAKKQDRFLIASDSSGGGSGKFSNLFWVRLTSQEIGVSKDLMGGDRCDGGLSNYGAEGRAIDFAMNTPAEEIISLTGVQIDKSIADQLAARYPDCDGAAHYRYDLATEELRLSSVVLNAPDTPAAASGPQACFDRLVRQYGENKKTALNPEKLKEFGRAFITSCTSRGPGSAGKSK